MNEFGQTWHYGLVARHWAENNTTGPEIAFYLRMIEQYGQPALDAGCGTGRLLIPFLRAGVDVDGCDVSEDMLAYCQQAAEREGFAPQLYRQALAHLDVPRAYQTIVACGVFGVGVSRAQDFRGRLADCHPELDLLRSGRTVGQRVTAKALQLIQRHVRQRRARCRRRLDEERIVDREHRQPGPEVVGNRGGIAER